MCALYSILYGNSVSVTPAFSGQYFIQGEKDFHTGPLTAADSYRFFVQSTTDDEITVSILNIPRDEKVVLQSFSGTIVEYSIIPYGPTEYWIRVYSPQTTTVNACMHVNHHSWTGTFLGAILLFIAIPFWLTKNRNIVPRKEKQKQKKLNNGLLISLVLVVLILTLAFLARFSLQDYPIKNDEFGFGRFQGYIDEAKFINEQFKEGANFDNYLTNFLGHPTLLRYLMAFSFQIFPSWTDVAAAHFPITIISSLTCAVVYYLGKDLYNEHVGILAGLFLAFSPIFINYGKSSYPHEPLAFFMSLSLLALYRGITASNRLYILLSSIFCGLALGTHEYSILLPPIIGIWLLFVLMRKFSYPNKIKSLPKLLFKRHYLIDIVMYLSIILVTYILSFPWLWPDPMGRVNRIFGGYSQQSTGGHPIYFLGEIWTHGPPIYAIASYFIGYETPIMTLMFAFGIIYLIKKVFTRKSRLEDILIILWFGIIFSYFSFTMLKLVPHIVIFYPPLAIISGLGLTRITETIRRLLIVKNWSR